MQFRIDLRAVSQRRISIEVTVDQDPSAGAVDLFMPVWTPGSYLVREYSRHITDVSAVDANTGAPLEVVKTAKNRYRVERTDRCAQIVFRYSVYAHSLTVREAWAGEEFAYWNGACAYFWPVGSESQPAEIRVELPDGWRLYCDKEVDADGSFRVSDLDDAVDTPCLALADADVLEFEACGKPHRFVCAGLAGIRPPESLVADSKSVIEQAAAIFGDALPFESYTFLALFSDSGRGGLEHRNSTTLLAPRTTFAPRRSYEEFISLVAHEYFHVWNVKRMRPVEFQTFDYEGENYTRLLWVAEGVTSYYDDYLCVRAGIVDARSYLDTLSGHVRNLRKMPGRHVQSLGDASFDAWIRFYRPDENTRNITQNYYSNGALATLCLDARIRDLTDGEQSFDDALARLYAKTAETGYTFEDVAACLAEVAGQDLGAELESLVNGPFEPSLDQLFGVYGLDVRWKRDDTPRLGVQLRKGSTRLATVFDGTPAWSAGLAPDDEVIAIGGLRVRSDSWGAVFSQLARHGEPLEMLIARQGRMKSMVVVPERSERADVEIRATQEPSERQLRLREQWLGTTASRLG